ncbi:MAG TPA: putative O-glycosylation ligase, exosortase A system-associated [Thermoanaerobaculia bacterium]|nr:putative O-glycosylation ligase, exosortase A system-associated [Thermoanaerobaculia bacterium]
MRDILVLAAVYASLPLILFSPFSGLMVYSWLAYMRPQDLGWGMTKVMPLSEWVAIALAVGLVLTIGRERLLAFRPQTILLLLLCGWISVTVMTALIPELSAEIYGNYWKAILIGVLTTGLVRDKHRLRLLLLLIAFSIGFLGAKHGIHGLVRGGARFDHGPGGLMNDNNTFALALNMALPLLVGFATIDRSKLVRWTAAGMAMLSMLTIFFTFSRGGLLTLGVVACLLVWRTRQRALAALILVLGIGGFVMLTRGEVQDEYLERTGTIQEYEEDRSALGRLDAWTTSWRVFRDYPLTGVGPNNLSVVHARYSPDPERFRVSHNSYLQLLSESGWPACALFVALLLTTLWRLELLRRTTASVWMQTQAHMLQIALAGYMVGAFFLNMAYFDLIYHLVGVAVSLELAAAAEAAAGGADAAPAAVAEELPWWKRPPQPAGAPGRA